MDGRVENKLRGDARETSPTTCGRSCGPDLAGPQSVQPLELDSRRLLTSTRPLCPNSTVLGPVELILRPLDRLSLVRHDGEHQTQTQTQQHDGRLRVPPEPRRTRRPTRAQRVHQHAQRHAVSPRMRIPPPAAHICGRTTLPPPAALRRPSSPSPHLCARIRILTMIYPPWSRAAVHNG